MSLPYFSVIIPTLNEEKFLPKLLKDLEKQIFNDFEVLIIDGGSTDGTLFTIEKFKKKLEIRILQLNKKSVSFQRNYGAKRAKGKFLVFLDADTRITSSFLKKIYKFITKEKSLIIVPFILSTEKGAEIKVLFDIVNWLIALSQRTTKPFSSGGNIIVEKNFFYLIGGFNDKLFLAEDHDLIQKAHQWGVKAKLSPKIKVKFNLRRMKREGRLVFLYKSLLSTFHVLIKGKITKKIFDYPMGGAYLNSNKKLSKLSFSEINNYIKKIRKFLDIKL